MGIFRIKFIINQTHFIYFIKSTVESRYLEVHGTVAKLRVIGNSS